MLTHLVCHHTPTYQICAYPLQLMRTRLQSSGLPGRPMYSSMSHVFREVYAADGPTGFYRGITANFMKAIPATAITYVCFEKSKTYFAPIFDPSPTF